MPDNEIQKAQRGLHERYPGCPNHDKINPTCTCPGQNCPLHGHCCACVAWHRDHAMTPLPHCLRDIKEVSWEQRERRLQMP